MILPGSLVAPAMRAGLMISPCPRAFPLAIARSTEIAAAAPITLIACALPVASLHRYSSYLPADRLRRHQRGYLSARVGAGRQPPVPPIARPRDPVPAPPRRRHS